ncbi:MAG: dihydroorotase [Candidatus Moraniibacteriota bacterium]
MTVYLHKGTTVEDVRLAKVHGMDFKFYPKNPTHGTTGSQAGVPSLRDVDDAIAAMAEYGVRLLVHGESAVHSDILDLERYFIQEELVPTVEEHPNLLLVAEHITTKEAVQFVLNTSANVTATVTPQHLWYSINSLFEGGLRPFRYCLPLYKHIGDKDAIIQAIVSGSQKFCAGDDTAPHPEHGPRGKAKLADCGCAGAYVAPVSVPMYVAAFEAAGALDDRLENFMSVNGALTRDLPLNNDLIIIERKPWTVSESDDYGDDKVVPLCAGETIEWQAVSS